MWVPARRAYEYDDAYPAQRGHHDAVIARCKQVTLKSWVRQFDRPVAQSRVLEVGFGGGATLAWLQAQGAFVCGQELVAANRTAACAQGIPAERIEESLASFAGLSFHQVLYLDAFEHILDPAPHLRTLGAVTARGSQAMLVLPVADSVSRKLLGRWWPHDIDDHWVFYSTAGLTALWAQAGWRLVRRFTPWKYLSALTIARHIEMKTPLRLPAERLKNAGVWLNFGERGLIFERL